MGRNVIALITFYLILRAIFSSMMDVSFIVEIFRMYFNNCACHPAGFGIPAHMISNF